MCWCCCLMLTMACHVLVFSSWAPDPCLATDRSLHFCPSYRLPRSLFLYAQTYFFLSISNHMYILVPFFLSSRHANLDSWADFCLFQHGNLWLIKKYAEKIIEFSGNSDTWLKKKKKKQIRGVCDTYLVKKNLASANKNCNL